MLTAGSVATYNDAVRQLRDAAENRQEELAAERAADRAERAVAEAEQRATDAFLAINRHRDVAEERLREAQDRFSTAEDRLAGVSSELDRLLQVVGSGDRTDVLFALQDVGFSLDDLGFAVQDAEWALQDTLVTVADLEATAGDLEAAIAATGRREVNASDEIQIETAREDASRYRQEVAQLTGQLNALQPMAQELWVEATEAAGTRDVSQERFGYGAP